MFETIYSNSIKRARQKSGLTQKEVEEKLGMRNLTMRDYEVGRLKLPVTIALQLAKLYNVTMDELLNYSVSYSKEQAQILLNFRVIFNGNGFSSMFLDPVLRAYLEEHQEKYFDNSFFDLLTLDLSDKKRKELVCEIGMFLSSLAGIDGKVSASELECVNYLLESFELTNKFKVVAKNLTEAYLPKSLPQSLTRAEIKHFIIWLLFFFAQADKEISFQEVEYIDKCAECLRLNRNNYLFIKAKFTKEKL